MNRPAGKAALITGPARGIVRAFAEAPVREGASVVTVGNLAQNHDVDGGRWTS